MPQDPMNWNELAGPWTSSQSAIQEFRSFAGSVSLADLFEGDPDRVEQELQKRYESLAAADRRSVEYSYQQLRNRIRNARHARSLTERTEQIRGILEGGAAERGGGFLESASNVAGSIAGHGQATFNALSWLQRNTINALTGWEGTVGGGLSELAFGQDAAGLTVEEAQRRATVAMRTLGVGLTQGAERAREFGAEQEQAMEDMSTLMRADAIRLQMGLPGLLTEQHREQMKSMGIGAPDVKAVVGRGLDEEVGNLVGFLAGAKMFGSTMSRVPIAGSVLGAPGKFLPGPLGRIGQEAATFGAYEAAAQQTPEAILPGAAFGGVMGATGELLGAAGRSIQRGAGEALVRGGRAAGEPLSAGREMLYRAAGQFGAGLEQLGGRSTPFAAGGRPALGLSTLRAQAQRLPETMLRVPARMGTEYAKLGTAGAASTVTGDLQAGREVDIGRALGESFGNAHTAWTSALFGLTGRGGRFRSSELPGRERAKRRKKVTGFETLPRERGETKQEWFERMRTVEPTYTKFTGRERRELEQIERMEADAAKRNASVRLTERQQALKDRVVRASDARFADPIKTGPLRNRRVPGVGTDAQPPEFAPTGGERLLGREPLRQQMPGSFRVLRRVLLEKEGRTISQADVEALRRGERPANWRKWRPEVREWIQDWVRQDLRQRTADAMLERYTRSDMADEGEQILARRGGMIVEGQGRAETYPAPEYAGRGQAGAEAQVEFQPLAKRMSPLVVAELTSPETAERIANLAERREPGDRERTEDVLEDVAKVAEAKTPEEKQQAVEAVEKTLDEAEQAPKKKKRLSSIDDYAEARRQFAEKKAGALDAVREAMREPRGELEGGSQAGPRYRVPAVKIAKKLGVTLDQATKWLDELVEKGDLSRDEAGWYSLTAKGAKEAEAPTLPPKEIPPFPEQAQASTDSALFQRAKIILKKHLKLEQLDWKELDEPLIRRLLTGIDEVRGGQGLSDMGARSLKEAEAFLNRRLDQLERAGDTPTPQESVPREAYRAGFLGRLHRDGLTVSESELGMLLEEGIVSIHQRPDGTPVYTVNSYQELFARMVELKGDSIFEWDKFAKRFYENVWRGRQSSPEFIDQLKWFDPKVEEWYAANHPPEEFIAWAREAAQTGELARKPWGLLWNMPGWQGRDLGVWDIDRRNVDEVVSRAEQAELAEQFYSTDPYIRPERELTPEQREAEADAFQKAQAQQTVEEPTIKVRLSDADRQDLEVYASERAKLRYPYPVDPQSHHRVRDLSRAAEEPFVRFLEQYKGPDGKVDPKVAFDLVLESQGYFGAPQGKTNPTKKAKAAWEVWDKLVGIRGGAEAFEELLKDYRAREKEAATRQAPEMEKFEAAFEQSFEELASLKASTKASTLKNYLRRYAAEQAVILEHKASNHVQGLHRAKERLFDAVPKGKREKYTEVVMNMILGAEQAAGLHTGDNGARLLANMKIAIKGTEPGVGEAWQDNYLNMLMGKVHPGKVASSSAEWEAIDEFLRSQGVGTGEQAGTREREYLRDESELREEAAREGLVRDQFEGDIADLNERFAESRSLPEATGPTWYSESKQEMQEAEPGKVLLLELYRYGNIGRSVSDPRKAEALQTHYITALEREGVVRKMEASEQLSAEDAALMSNPAMREALEALGITMSGKELQYAMTERGLELIRDMNAWMIESGRYEGIAETYHDGFFQMREDPFTRRCLSTCGIKDLVEFTTRAGKRIVNLAKLWRWERSNTVMTKDMLAMTSSVKDRLNSQRPFFRNVVFRALFQTWGDVIPQTAKASQANYDMAFREGTKMIRAAFFSPHADRTLLEMPRQFVDPEGFNNHPQAERVRDLSRALDGDGEAMARLSEKDRRWLQDIHAAVFDRMRPELAREIFRRPREAAEEAVKQGVQLWASSVPDFAVRMDRLATQIVDGQQMPMSLDARRALLADPKGAKIVLQMIDAKAQLRPGEYRTFQFKGAEYQVNGWGIAEYLPHRFLPAMGSDILSGDVRTQLGDHRYDPTSGGAVTYAERAAVNLYAQAYPHAQRPRMLRYMLERIQNKDGWIEDLPWLLEVYVNQSWRYIARSRTLDVARTEMFGDLRRIGERNPDERRKEQQRLQQDHPAEWKHFLGEAFQYEHITPRGFYEDIQGAPSYRDLSATHTVHGVMAPEFLLESRGRVGRYGKKGERRFWAVDWESSTVGQHDTPRFTDKDVLVLVDPSGTVRGEAIKVRLVGKQILGAKLYRRRGGVADVVLERGKMRGYQDLVERVVTLAQGFDANTFNEKTNGLAAQAARSVNAATDFLGRMLYRGMLGGILGINSKAAMVNVIEGVGVQNLAAMGGYTWWQGNRIMADFTKRSGGFMKRFYENAFAAPEKRKSYHELMNEWADGHPNSLAAEAWNYVWRDSPYQIGQLRQIDFDNHLNSHEGGIVLNSLRYIPGVHKVSDLMAQKGRQVKEFLENRYDPVHFAWFEYSELMTRMHLILGYGYELGKRYDPTLNGGEPWQNPDTGVWYAVTNKVEKRGTGQGTYENPEFLAVQDLVFDRVEATHFHYKKALMPGIMRLPGWGAFGHLGTYSSRLMIEAGRDVGSLLRYIGMEDGDTPANRAGVQRLLMRMLAMLAVREMVSQVSGLDLSQYGGVHPRDIPIVNQLPGVELIPDAIRLAGGPPSFPTLPVKLAMSGLQGLGEARLEAELANQAGEGFGPGDHLSFIGRRMRESNPSLAMPDLGMLSLPAYPFTIPFSRGTEPFLRAWTSKPDPNQAGNVLYGPQGRYPVSIPKARAWAAAFLPGSPEEVTARYRDRARNDRLERYKTQAKGRAAEEIVSMEAEERFDEADTRFERASRVYGPMDSSLRSAEERQDMTANRVEIQRAGDPQLKVRRALQLWDTMTPDEQFLSWRDIFGKRAKPGTVPLEAEGYFQGVGNQRMLEEYIRRWESGD